MKISNIFTNYLCAAADELFSNWAAYCLNWLTFLAHPNKSFSMCKPNSTHIAPAKQVGADLITKPTASDVWRYKPANPPL